MKKLVLVNSFGPMGASLLAALLEKLGFTNVPMRKMGLHKYLMGEYDLNCGYMEQRLVDSLINHSQPGALGGVSVLDRDDKEPIPLTDYEIVKGRTENITFDTLQELYFNCRKIYCDAVVYKDIASNTEWQTELTTDIHRFDHKRLFDAYKDAFDEVHMIHLHRPFSAWMNSLSSQAFVHPKIKSRVKFFPHLRYADFKLYEKAVEAMPGMHVDFDDMFNIPIDELYGSLAKYTNVEPMALNLKSADYDLFGKIVPYGTAFKKFDDNIEFLTPSTKRYLASVAEGDKILNFPDNLVSYFRYLADMRKYRGAHNF